MSTPDFDPRGYVATLPQRPGVYRMYAADGELLYVGKASRLRDRVGSYFSARHDSPKIDALVRRVSRIEVTVAPSEPEALLLESNLIKAHRPRYNIALRDDKSYPYILCQSGHDYPRIVFYRGPRQPGARQFGPFPSAYAVKEVLLHLQQVFRIRNCRDSFFAHRSRPCLQYQIGRCSAPCVGWISRQEYARDLAGAIGVLEGRNDEVIGGLQRRMDEAAAALQFEQAARLRDQLRELQEIRAQQGSQARRATDVDAVAVCGEPGRYAICVLPVREGQNLGTASHFPGHALSEPAETLADFLLLYYRAEAAPPQILVNLELPDREALGGLLAQAAGHAVELRVPRRGLGLRWLQLAQDNAHNALRMRALKSELAAEGMQVLARVLSLPAAPERVECFDISHTAGEGTVASCVVFTSEGPRKRDYRRYNIAGVTPGDDYGAMHQALRRHGARIAAGERARPDLLLIDGGPGQVQAAVDALAESGCEDLAVVGVSKGADRRPGQERLHRAGDPIPLQLEADSPALHFVQRVRDEAHRFAITGHRRRRARRYRESILETVPGLGPARRRALLTHFGGLQGVMRAGVTELEKAPSLGPALARSLYEHLHPGGRMIWNLPNLLTWLRILAIPLIVVLFLLGVRSPGSPADPLAGLLFALAALTDTLDGYLARRLGQTTRLGSFLDPVADKLIVAVALVLIVSRDARALIVLTAAVIIGREIAISALREWMAGIGQRTAVAVSRIGKFKTILQMTGLTLLLFRHDLWTLPTYLIGQWLTVIAAALTLFSAAVYLRAAWPHLSAPT